MTNQRESILRYAAENFGTTPEYLWKSTPDAAVLVSFLISVCFLFFSKFIGISSAVVGVVFSF